MEPPSPQKQKINKSFLDTLTKWIPISPNNSCKKIYKSIQKAKTEKVSTSVSFLLDIYLVF
jgi:hypothetical protein